MKGIFPKEKQKRLKIDNRLCNDCIWHRNLRNIIQNNSNTTQNTNRWSNKEHSAMKYDSTIDYRNDPAISIGSPTINTFKYHVFAPMGRFQLELIYLYFPPSLHLIVGCFCPVGLSLLY